MKKQMNKQYERAYITYNKAWESEFDNIVSRKDKVQDLYINQLKIQTHDSYKKDERITTNFKSVNDEDVINKACLDKKFSKKMVIYCFQ